MTSCDENPYFNGCTCNPRFGEGGNYRVLELSTQTYHCCGEVSYTQNVGDANDQFCTNSGWWQSALLPEIALGSSSSGPPTELLSAQFAVSQLAQQIPIATMSLDVNGNQNYSCTNYSTYSAPRLVSYLNPNNGSKYAQVIGCVPLNSTNNGIAGTDTVPYTTGDFALYELKGCNTDTTKWLQTCIPAGPVSNINNVSSQSYKTSYYSGSVNNGTSGNSTEVAGMQRLPFIVVAIIFAILIILLILFISSSHKYKTALHLAIPSNTTAIITTPANPILSK
jgi:preprotein translocase subunit SecG